MENDKSFVVFIIPSLIFLAITAIVVRIFAVNVPYRDEWFIIDFLHKAVVTHNLRLSDLFAQYNEHRFFLVRLIYLANYFIKPFDLIRLLYVNQLLIFASSCLTLLLIKKEIRLSLAISILVSAENFLFAVQIAFILSNLFFLLAVFTLSKAMPDPFKYLIAFLFCALATLSSVWGLITFFALFVLIVLTGLKKENMPSITLAVKAIAWLAGTLIIFGLYFHGYVRPPDHPSPIFVVNHPLQTLYFLAAVIGAFPDYVLSKGAVEISMVLSGAIIAAAYIFFMFKKCRDYPVLLTLATYGMLSALLVTFGRSSFGIEQAAESRYMICTMFLPLGVVLMASEHFKTRKSIIIAASMVVLILASLIAIPREMSAFQNRFATAKEGLRKILLNNDYSDEKRLRRLFLGPKSGRKSYIIKYKQLRIDLKDLDKGPRYL
jgi:hypothetical protein